MRNWLKCASTAELNLLMDMAWDASVESSEQAELLMAVMGELKERGEIPDVTDEDRDAALEAMWRRIKERNNANSTAVCEDKRNPAWVDRLNKDMSEDQARAAARFRRFRSAAISTAAAVLLLFFANTVAIAAGHNLLGTVAKWSSDAMYYVFGIDNDDEPSKVVNYEYGVLKVTLKNLRIQVDLPSHIPDDFIFDSIAPDEPDELSNIVAWYVCNDRFFSISIKRFDFYEDAGFFESDGAGDTEVYPESSGKYLITRNMDRVAAMWHQGLYEITIQGNITYEQLTSILDSI
jgi:hypothetical protein